MALVLGDTGEIVTRVLCQVCGYEMKAKSDAEREEMFDRWRTNFYRFPEGILPVLCCPKCMLLEKLVAFERYKDRISSGKDLSYH